jgi:hypothetical protein
MTTQKISLKKRRETFALIFIVVLCFVFWGGWIIIDVALK